MLIQVNTIYYCRRNISISFFYPLYHKGMITMVPNHDIVRSILYYMHPLVTRLSILQFHGFLFTSWFSHEQVSCKAAFTAHLVHTPQKPPRTYFPDMCTCMPYKCHCFQLYEKFFWAQFKLTEKNLGSLVFLFGYFLEHLSVF